MSHPALLERMTAIDGVRAIIIAGRDGFVIARVPESAADIDTLAAYGASALSAAEGIGAHTHRAALIGLVIEYSDALVALEPLGEYALIIARLDSAAALVPLRQALRSLRNELLAQLDQHA